MELFQPDNFTDSAVRYRPITANEQETVGAVIRAYLPNARLVSAQQFTGTEINSHNFKVTLEHDGIEATYLLRRAQFLDSQKNLDFHVRILEFLLKEGQPVPVIIPLSDGKKILSYQNNFYVLYNFISGDHFAPTEQAYRALARAVAKMHISLAALPTDLVKETAVLSAQNVNVYYNQVLLYTTRDFTMFQELVVRDAPEEWRSLFEEQFKRIPTLVRQIGDTAVDLLPKQIIHSDLHPHNILMLHNSVTALLDFDSVRFSERIRDVATALYRFGRQFLVQNHYSLAEQSAKARSLFEIFIEEYTAVNPLSEDELRALPFIAADEFLTKILFVLQGVYRRNNSVWKKDLPIFFSALAELPFFYE